MTVPEVVAVDADEGWLLMKDSGVWLRSLLQADGDIGRWHTALSKMLFTPLPIGARLV
jgi:hypothetical protein